MSNLFYPKKGSLMGPHFIARIHYDNPEKWIVSVQHDSDLRPYVREPKMRGSELVFPKQWGKKRGALELIRQRLAMDEETLRDAAESIGNMLQVLNDVETWPDDRINKWNTKPTEEAETD